MKGSDVALLAIAGLFAYQAFNKQLPEGGGSGGGDTSLNLGGGLIPNITMPEISLPNINIESGGDSGIAGVLAGLFSERDPLANVLDWGVGKVEDAITPDWLKNIEQNDFMKKITDAWNTAYSGVKEFGDGVIESVTGTPEEPIPQGQPGGDSEFDISQGNWGNESDFGKDVPENTYGPGVTWWNPLTWGNWNEQARYRNELRSFRGEAWEDIGIPSALKESYGERTPHERVNFETIQRAWEADLLNRQRELLAEQYGEMWKGLPPGTELVEVETIPSGTESGQYSVYIPDF